MEVLIRGIKDARRILTAPAFDYYRGEAVFTSARRFAQVVVRLK